MTRTHEQYEPLGSHYIHEQRPISEDQGRVAA